MQRQGISAPPGDLALGIQAFELADEQHAEVAARRDRRAANAVLVVPLAQHLDGFVELGLGQHLIAPVTASGSSAVPISTSKNFMPDLSTTSYDPPVGASLLATLQTYQPRTKCTRLQRL